MGVQIIPPMMSYYQGFQTIDEWTDNFVERLLAKLGLRNSTQAWKGM